MALGDADRTRALFAALNGPIRKDARLPAAVLGATAVVALAAVVGASQPAAGAGARIGSGIRGLVTIGPTCPVVMPGRDCADRPYDGFVRAYRSGRYVARTRSGADGRYRLRLRPGRYTLRASPPRRTGIPAAVTRRARVSTGRVTRVNFTLDSGIR